MPLRVLMEACGSAHYWERRFAGQGCAVRLLSARDVRLYVRRNKIDRADVAGILGGRSLRTDRPGADQVARAAASA